MDFVSSHSCILRHTRCEGAAVMLGAARRSAFQVARRAGLFETVGRTAWRRQRLLILCYHGVALRDEHEWNPFLYVSVATLARRLELLERHGCQVLRLEQALSLLSSGELPRRAVVLTFDDGFYDFLARAWPLLNDRGFPATVYLTTQRCEHNFPIVRGLTSYVLWKQRSQVLDGAGLPGLGEAHYPLATAAQREVVFARFIGAIEGLKPAPKDVVVRELATRLGADYEALCRERMLTLMNPAEVAALSAAGVDFELHTHRHRTPSDAALFAEEVLRNQERLESMIGRRPAHFCYPSGVWRESYLPQLRAAGVRSAVTSDAGLASRSSHALLLPRVLDHEGVTAAEFEAWLTGAAAWVPRRRALHPD
jgi:peptidoglycan/xylan/chitin deacetylase (PgdA/CDA1 family)